MTTRRALAEMALGLLYVAGAVLLLGVWAALIQR